MTRRCAPRAGALPAIVFLLHLRIVDFVPTSNSNSRTFSLSAPFFLNLFFESLLCALLIPVLCDSGGRPRRGRSRQCQPHQTRPGAAVHRGNACAASAEDRCVRVCVPSADGRACWWPGVSRPLRARTCARNVSPARLLGGTPPPNSPPPLARCAVRGGRDREAGARQSEGVDHPGPQRHAEPHRRHTEHLQVRAAGTRVYRRIAPTPPPPFPQLPHPPSPPTRPSPRDRPCAPVGTVDLQSMVLVPPRCESHLVGMWASGLCLCMG